MAVFNNVLAGAAGQAGGAAGYEIERSLRFNSADSAYLNRTPSSAGNRKTWTWSGWVKRVKFGAYDHIFGHYDTDFNPQHLIRFMDSDRLEYIDYTGTYQARRVTTAKYRDPSAWMHIVVAWDTTQTTADDRVKIYVNGDQITDFDEKVNPSQNYEGSAINTIVAHGIGKATPGSGYLNAYLADVHFIDGQALAASDFGESDTNGVWQPIEYTGTYGTNGFHLDFSDNSTAAALGTDAAGSNDWTVNNVQVENVDATAGVQSGITSAPINNTPYGNPTQWFDGNLATGAGVDGGSSDTTPRKWTFNTPISFSSSVKLRISTNTTGMGYHFNGVNTSLANNTATPTYYTVATGSGTMTDVGVYNSNGSSSGTIHISAIEVDGSLLIATPPQGNDSLLDSPQNGTQTDTGAGGEVSGNYCTLNPLRNGGLTLSNGNLQANRATTSWQSTFGTIGITSGKYFWEAQIVTSASINYIDLGIANATVSPSGTYRSTSGYSYNGNDELYANGSYVSTYGGTYTAGDIIGVAFDADAGTLVYYKNGTSLGTAFSSIPSGTWFPAVALYGTREVAFNFGQRPFAYTAPSGYKALCTANLDDPTIADGSTAMDVVTYTGDNTFPRSILDLGFSPDFVWTKIRSQTYRHMLFDTVRGTGKNLTSSNTAAETTNDDYGYISAFNSDGWTIAEGAVSGENFNANTETYVAWTWDAGTSTVSNTDGSITSSVRANASAGFSIVTWTAPASVSTVGHGLNATPQFIISRNRGGGNWAIYHASQGAGYYFEFSTQAAILSSGPYNSTAPSSTVFTTGASSWWGTGNMIAYCFAPVEGYSAFGSYVGNGSATDGPFIYTGFRPKFILWKKTNTATNAPWVIADTARSTYNLVRDYLLPNTSDAEASVDLIDVLSNGYKWRGNAPGGNNNGDTYIYAAFAENPFKTARAR